MSANDFKITCWEFGTEVQYEGHVYHVVDWSYEKEQVQIVIDGETMWLDRDQIEVVI